MFENIVQSGKYYDVQIVRSRNEAMPTYHNLNVNSFAKFDKVLSRYPSARYVNIYLRLDKKGKSRRFITRVYL